MSKWIAAALALAACLAAGGRAETSSMPVAFSDAFPRLDTDELIVEHQFERPCADWRPPGGTVGVDLPLCRCSSSTDNGTNINCDRVVFPGDFPLLPFRHRVHGFSQRSAGYQSFPAQLFTASDVPIKRLDMSHNGVVLITERLLDGLEDTLEDINLSHNLLGDQLNPIFSTSEFQNLKQLKRLDLSANDLKAVDDALLKGCDKLQELRLGQNSLTRVPSGTLKESRNLLRLYLEHNKIGSIGNELLLHQHSLRFLNVSRNVIASVDVAAFKGLALLQKMDLSFNKLSRLPDKLFQETPSLQDIDLSNNFLSSIPPALKGVSALKKLSLSANLIQNLDSGTLAEMSSLESLDLSRNSIAELPNGTLSSLNRLKVLQFGVNTLRKVEEGAFRGLEHLEELFLDDNNMLAVPQAALRHVTKLRRLSLAFNRIAVVSGQLFSSTTDLQHLSLAHNVIRELPDDAFQPLKSLRRLELRGNQLTAVNVAALRRLASILHDLDLGWNRISELEQLELPQLQYLKLDHNNLTALKRGQFSKLANLISLNMSHNNIDLIPSGVFRGLNRLRQVDLRSNNLATLAVGVFEGLSNLRAIYLQDNFIQQLDSRSFSQLPQLRLLQLSRNQIGEVRVVALDNVPQLRKLVLRHNRLESVPRILSPATNATLAVEALDLGYNNIRSLGANDFANWTRLEHVIFTRNRLSNIDELAFYQHRSLKIVDLSYNKLKALPDNLLSKFPRLRAVDLSHNQLESLSLNLFQNSTQLQMINLGHNRLASLHERLLMGLTRLHLNLEHNRLTHLPGKIFDRSRLHGLQSINLQHNQLEEIPVEALQKQFFFLDYLNLGHNRIRHIGSDSNVLVTIKTLDLSFNPLTEDSIHNVLSEPKKVKDLNMAATGIAKLSVLETPFLRRLNLSSNRIDQFGDNVFQRPSLLEVLDLSRNRISAIQTGLSGVWTKVVFLKELMLSGNPLVQIARGDLANLASLESLDLSNLPACVKIDSQAFANLPNLRSLRLFGLPRLESLQSRAILQHISTLEEVEIEITEPALQDQLAPALLPRIRQLHVHGRGGLRSISPATLAGMTSPSLRFALHDTAITNIPASLLFPVPMSTNLVVDLSGAKLPVLSPQFLAAADNHRQLLELRGLRDNPIVCDCNARPFRRWLKAHVPQRGFRGSRRTPRQIVHQADESSSILVRVSASSILGSRAVRPNETRPTEGSQINDLVTLRLGGSSTLSLPKPADAQVTTPAALTEVSLVTAGYAFSTEDLQSTSSASNSEEVEASADEESATFGVSLSRELSQVRCSAPSSLLGVKLIDIAEEDLGCDGLGRGEVVVPVNENEAVKDTIDVVVAARPARPFHPPPPPIQQQPAQPPAASAPSREAERTNQSHDEPDIIWYYENEETQAHPTLHRHPSIIDKDTISKDLRRPQLDVAGKYGKHAIDGHGNGIGLRGGDPAANHAGLNNMDALIIGIVGGVVAFVAILIIIICLVRLRTGTPYRGGPLAAAVALRHDKCTCVGPGGGGHPSALLCHCLPGYPGHALHGPPALPALPGLPSLPLPLPPPAGPPSCHRGNAGRSSIYSVPLPRKIGAPPAVTHPPPRSALGLASRSSFYPPTPYYVTFPPDSDTDQHR